VIVCHSDEEWQRLVQVMGAPSWAASSRFATGVGRLQHQEELDERIEAWSMTLEKYELTERCQSAGVRALPVQSAEDRVEHDPQLRHREMYLPMEHPALGRHKLQNAPFKLRKRRRRTACRALDRSTYLGDCRGPAGVQPRRVPRRVCRRHVLADKAGALSLHGGDAPVSDAQLPSGPLAGLSG